MKMKLKTMFMASPLKVCTMKLSWTIHTKTESIMFNGITRWIICDDTNYNTFMNGNQSNA